MNHAEQTRKNIEEIFTAMETPEKWKAFVKSKNMIFSGKIDQKKAEEFSDYLTKHFIDVCNDPKIAGRFINWKAKKDDEKIDLARDIVSLFMAKIKDDILNNRIALNGPNTGNPHFEQIYRQEIAEAIRETKVTKNTGMRAFMSTSNWGDLSINTTCLFYREFNSALFFLMDLRHELTHIIDVLAPDISPLDNDIRMMAIRYYDNTENALYDNNPLELNANTKRREYRIKIQEMLRAQEVTFANGLSHQDSR